jgi:hypothetical protein
MPRISTATILVAFLSLSSSASIARAQAVTEDWVSFHPGFQSVGVVTSDDGFIYIAGRSDLTADNGFRSDIVTIKYDLDGNQIWLREFDEASDGTNGTDEPTWLTLDPFGNVIVTGISFINTTGDDILTLKYDPAGNLLWQARSDEGVWPSRVATDANGSVYVAGVTSFSDSAADFITIKYDANGNELWTQINPGGFGDSVSGLAVSAAGEAVVVGESSNGESCFDATTLFYEADGTQRWMSSYTSDIVCGLDSGSDVALGLNGEVYVGGHEANGSNTAFLLIRYDAAGNQVWVRTHDETLSQLASRLMVDSFGNPVLTGVSNSDFTTLKYDTNGNQLWVSHVDIFGEDIPFNMAIGPDDAVYITGGSTSIATAKLDTNGALQWSAFWDAAVHSDIGWGVALDTTGNVIVSGQGQSQILTLRYLQEQPPVDELSITVTPIDPPIVIPPEGGSFEYQLSVVNTSDVTKTFDLWLTTAGSGPDRTRGPFTRMLAPGASLSRTLRMTIPGGAPAGSYTQTGSIGTFPTADVSDSFAFEKSAALP